ncbi:MAG: ModD protein [Chlorobiales bacterium]|jgi:molybdenum transport protein|nr:ModD protein [Chlorobiales bacterium]
MSVLLSDDDIFRLIKEDVPYFDLTTVTLGIGKRSGLISFYTRHKTVICCTEEVARVFEKCGAVARNFVPSGQRLPASTLILEAEGPAESLHMAWKVSLNLLEYTSGIATRTRDLVDAAISVNPSVSVVTTRKVFPGTKALAVKAVLAGGGELHRLGISETVLVFKQHLAFTGGFSGFIGMIDTLKHRNQEKKIGVEVETEAEALAVAKAGVDLIQFDKIAAPELQRITATLKAKFPALKIAAAGGITPANIKEYADTGVDLLVTTSPYFGKPADIRASMIAI